MQRIHLLNNKELDNLSGNTAHAVLPEFMSIPNYSRFFKERSERKEFIYALSGCKHITKQSINLLKEKYGVHCIILNSRTGLSSYVANKIKDAKMVLDNGLSVVIELSVDDIDFEYNVLCNCESNVGIALPVLESNIGNGVGRFSFIRNKVMRKEWDFSRKYYLSNLENPAELAYYAKLFTFKVQSTIIGCISLRCYVDSMFGIQYSPGLGTFVDFDIVRNNYLGYAYKSIQQKSLFQLNDEMFKGFISGKLGYELLTENKNVLKGDIINESI